MDSLKMTNFFHWVSAFRLRTLPLSISGIIVASSLAAYKGLFQWNIFILAILTTLSYQILSNLANDYGDGIKGTDNNQRIGPRRPLQAGLIRPQDMLVAIRINIAVSILFTVGLIYSAFGVKHLLLTLFFLVLGILAIYSAIKYTIGHSAYGYRALGDIFVFVFFGLVSVIGCYILFTKQIDPIVLLPAITLGMLSVGVLNLNNMRDRITDAASNKITIAVKFGEKNAKRYHFFLIISAMIISIIYSVLYSNSIVNFIFFLAFIPLLFHINSVRKIEDPKAYDPELKKLSLSTFILASLLALGLLL